MDDAEVSFVFELAWFLKLGVCAQLLQNFFDERLVCGLGKPALLVEQSEDSWGVILRERI